MAIRAPDGANNGEIWLLTNCSSQPSMVQQLLSSSIFPCLFLRLFVCPAVVTPNQISTFSIYTGIKASYQPSTTEFQAVPSDTLPVWPSTNQYRTILTQYHRESASSALYCPSTTKYKPVPPSTNPVPPSTDSVPSYIIYKCQTSLCQPEMSTVLR